MEMTKILNNYKIIALANSITPRIMQIMDTIFTHEQGEEFTVKQLGIEIMGEEYTKKVPNRWNKEYMERTSDARSMGCSITQALRKLEALGLVTRETRIDTEHPYTYEEEGYVFYDKQGNRVPEKINVTLDTGTVIQIDAYRVPNLESRWENAQRTAYPKITYWKLV